MPTEEIGPKAALVIACRSVMLLDLHVAAEGVYQGVAQREDELPYTVFMFRPRKPLKSLSSERDMLREYQLVVKVCAAEQGGLSAEAVAEPMKRAIYDLFTQTIDGEDAQTRLNTFLEPLGWTATKIVEVGDTEEYSDVVGTNKDIRRWHFGHLFNLRISKL